MSVKSLGLKEDITVGEASQYGMIFEGDSIKILKGCEFRRYFSALKEKAKLLDEVTDILFPCTVGVEP
jgi:hypothetical protein